PIRCLMSIKTDSTTVAIKPATIPLSQFFAVTANLPGAVGSAESLPPVLKTHPHNNWGGAPAHPALRSWARQSGFRRMIPPAGTPQWRDASVADPSSGAAAMTDCDGTSDCHPSTASMPRQAILAMLE